MDLRSIRSAQETRRMIARYEQLLDQGIKGKKAIKIIMDEFIYSYAAAVNKIKPRQVLARRQRKVFEEKVLIPKREKARQYYKPAAHNKPGRPRKPRIGATQTNLDL